MKMLADKVAVVTGAGSGIGRATALALADRGTDIVAADIRTDGLDEVTAEIEARGREALAVQVDVADRASMEALAERAIDWKGHVDIVINNAGVSIQGNAQEHTLEDWQWLLGINLWGVIHGVHFFLPHMIERGSGHFVNVASGAGLTATPGLLAYSTSKFGVVGLSEALRGEVAKHGIGVSVVCPGLVKTGIMYTARDLGTPMDRTLLDRYGRDPAKLAAKIVQAIRRNKRSVLFAPETHLYWAIKRFTPWLYDALLRFNGAKTEDIKQGRLPFIPKRPALRESNPAPGDN